MYGTGCLQNYWCIVVVVVVVVGVSLIALLYGLIEHDSGFCATLHTSVSMSRTRWWS